MLLAVKILYYFWLFSVSELHIFLLYALSEGNELYALWGLLRGRNTPVGAVPHRISLVISENL